MDSKANHKALCRLFEKVCVDVDAYPTASMHACTIHLVGHGLHSQWKWGHQIPNTGKLISPDPSLMNIVAIW